MAEYNFSEIESFWQKYWEKKQSNKVEVDEKKPKFYVLDMFPYPSGAGLHVGHPLGYIASDIFSRFKKLKGFNVLHPMGFDAFGLPAEQYAIQTGQHPDVTTTNNIKRYKEQLHKIGFAYDWDREVRTCDSDYYKWTQWVFIKLFNHYYDNKSQKAEPIENLIREFEINGSLNVNATSTKELHFSASEWKAMDEGKQRNVLMNYRLAFQDETTVNWCPELGTVLANDEVKDGYSVRGGCMVEQKPMKQWLLRVSAYSERLLQGLDKIDWSDSLIEMQKYWIGKSVGAEINFEISNSNKKIRVFTTRSDTLFGSTFMVLAPEHPIVKEITTSEYENEVNSYIEITSKRTERERLADIKKITGQFTGAYAIHPFTKNKMQIWIADYVLFQYGTGAVMSVPAHDSRDYAFAKHFKIPIVEVVSGGDISKESYDAKEGKLINSDFLNGLEVSEAIKLMNSKIEEKGIGVSKVNYKMRDAIFSRQRYWGEPFPVYYKNDIPYVLNEKELPLELPEVDKFLPTEEGEPPLARAKNWKTKEGYSYEYDTMPGFAGSSGYYLRYMDPKNNSEYFSKESNKYWQDVDLYIGGTEHATGHLIYSRFWNKFLFDIGKSCKDEPFKKLVNQGMIQGRSSFVYRINNEKYAEYLLWEKIKDNKLGIKFLKNYKDGHRRFDFYSQKQKLVLEIKCYKNLEKLESDYSDYFNKTNQKYLLIPIVKIFDNIDEVIDKIIQLIEGNEVSSFLEEDSVDLKTKFVSKNVKGRKEFSTPLNVDVNIVENDILDLQAFKKWRPEFKNAEFILEEGKYYCGDAVEKMSKSLHNVVNPDDVIEKYGADTFRMYEMFLGPIEQHKPWNTDGIEGVSKFLRKFWNLYFNKNNEFYLSDDKATEGELKILHKTIKKIHEDIEKLSFNTCVSEFMIATNELLKLNCNKKSILQPLNILLAPFAPHISEELWKLSGNEKSIATTSFPEYNEKYIREDSYDYPISINGKLRAKHSFSIDCSKDFVEDEVLKLETVKKWTDGKTVRKIIFVPKRIINIVVN
ncbi:MAG: class I tRNA ligase family protein [Bacteroidota bacterium]|nr:class I tRNA ligase family protein [Bacteroidota bacterium]